MKSVLLIEWKWPDDSRGRGARFWSLHAEIGDGRIRDWQNAPLRLEAISAQRVVLENDDAVLLAVLDAAAANVGGAALHSELVVPS